MSVFDVLNTGTVTIVRNDPTKDAAGGPIADYVVVEAGVPAQVEYHRDKLFGNQIDEWDQSINLGQRDVWLNGTFDYLGDTGNGYGVIFEGTRFGRITAVERDFELVGMSASILLVVKVVDS